MIRFKDETPRPAAKSPKAAHEKGDVATKHETPWQRMTNGGNPCEGEQSGFDRKAYQRHYMRKRRATQGNGA